jgi:hypothetical protein
MLCCKTATKTSGLYKMNVMRELAAVERKEPIEDRGDIRALKHHFRKNYVSKLDILAYLVREPHLVHLVYSEGGITQRVLDARRVVRPKFLPKFSSYRWLTWSKIKNWDFESLCLELRRAIRFQNAGSYERFKQRFDVATHSTSRTYTKEHMYRTFSLLNGNVHPSNRIIRMSPQQSDKIRALRQVGISSVQSFNEVASTMREFPRRYYDAGRISYLICMS